jgi:hypothetical protein
MSVRFFKNKADFAENIRQALREGQEPVLDFDVLPFYSGKQNEALKQLGARHTSQQLYITSEDADWDARSGDLSGHAVVIGSKSMQVGEELAIKDSNYQEAWWVASIDVLFPPQQQQQQQSPMICLSWIYVPEKA